MNENADKTDIGAVLYEKIRADLLRRLEKDRIKHADMADVSAYSARLGKYLRQAIEANLSPDVLPDGFITTLPRAFLTRVCVKITSL